MLMQWKPLLALLFLSAFLTEVLSGNITFSAFFTPGIFLFLITIGYGFPILILREISVRASLPMISVFVLGFMYGLYNEAFLAKTVFHPGHSPIATFARYGLFDAIRVPWALLISVWHALFAVVYPVALVHWLFPKKAAVPWVRPSVLVPLGLVCFALGGVLYFKSTGTVPVAGSLRHLLLLLLGWALLAGVAAGLARVKKPAPALPPSKWRPPRQGVLFFLMLFFVPVLLAGAAVPVFVFFLYFSWALWFSLRKLRGYSLAQPMDLVRAGFGSQWATAVFLFLLALFNRDVERTITGAAFLFVLALGIFLTPRTAEATAAR